MDYIKDNMLVCDACGDIVRKVTMSHFAVLPADICSANKGESASVCEFCAGLVERKLEADRNNESFRRGFRND